MASILRVNTLTDASSNNSIATSVLFNGTAKAWATCITQSSTAIRDSYNNASLTDNGTGDTTFTLTSNMVNDDYFFGTCHAYYNNAYPRSTGGVRSINYLTTSTIRVEQNYCSTFGSGETYEDTYAKGYQMQGDLA
tara:strand:+ start:303 stop:710 length:408 start_codon:yes stop_codon:yes gene_type:complete